MRRPVSLTSCLLSCKSSSLPNVLRKGERQRRTAGLVSPLSWSVVCGNRKLLQVDVPFISLWVTWCYLLTCINKSGVFRLMWFYLRSTAFIFSDCCNEGNKTQQGNSTGQLAFSCISLLTVLGMMRHICKSIFLAVFLCAKCQIMRLKHYFELPI